MPEIDEAYSYALNQKGRALLSTGLKQRLKVL